MTTTRVARITQLLQDTLQPDSLEVLDESHLHAGHPGAATGMGHFRVRVISEKFQGLGTLQKHRLVYDALADMMKTDIHALAISASAPQSHRHGRN